MSLSLNKSFWQPSLGASIEDMTFISKQTASAATSLSFTSGIDNTYPTYIWEIEDIHFNTDDVQFLFQVSTNGGSSFGVSIVSFIFYGGHSATTSHTFGPDNITSSYGLNNGSTDYQVLGWFMPSDADVAVSGTVRLYGPSSTTYTKMCEFNLTFANKSDELVMTQGNAYFNTTTAIDAIDFKPSSGNFDGSISMYGIKDS
jgi:hypothetical protein